MDKPYFFEYFRSLPVPKGLEGDLLDEAGEPIKILSQLSHLNIFLGSNNSGKSRIIRELIREGIEPINISVHWMHRIVSPCNETIESFLIFIDNELHNLPSFGHLSKNPKSNRFIDNNGGLQLGYDYLQQLFDFGTDIYLLIKNITAVQDKSIIRKSVRLSEGGILE